MCLRGFPFFGQRMYVSFFSRFIFSLLFNGTPQMSLGNNSIEILSKNLLKVSDLKKINLNVKNTPISQRLPGTLFSELRVSNPYQGANAHLLLHVHLS